MIFINILMFFVNNALPVTENKNNAIFVSGLKSTFCFKPELFYLGDKNQTSTKRLSTHYLFEFLRNSKRISFLCV